MEQAVDNLDVQLRASALQLAASLVSKDGAIEALHVVPLAEAFYKFLKGE
jgi:hypothetical protein